MLSLETTLEYVDSLGGSVRWPPATNCAFQASVSDL